MEVENQHITYIVNGVKAEGHTFTSVNQVDLIVPEVRQANSLIHSNGHQCHETRTAPFPVMGRTQYVSLSAGLYSKRKRTELSQAC